jgi:hypothetical protein
VGNSCRALNDYERELHNSDLQKRHYNINK